MYKARRLIVAVLLLVALGALTNAPTWSQADPQYAQWKANSEALYVAGIDEDLLLNQLEQDYYVKDAGRGGAAQPGMNFPNLTLMDVNNRKYDLHETTLGEGKWVVALTGSGFT